MPHRKPFFIKKKTHKPARTGNGRYDAAADEVLEFTPLMLETAFNFDRPFALRLMRRDVNPKEAFTVRDALGNFFRASVKELNENGGVAVPYERMPVPPEPTVEITLACAVLARQRMIFVAQKATELGVTRIIPLITAHSVQVDGLEHEKAHAWPGQIIRAAKQCRRGSLPELLAPMPLEQFLQSPYVADAHLKLCLDNIGTGSPAPSEAPKKIVLLIGPEGGFSETERQQVKAGWMSWLLGGRVLRAETAVLAGLTAVQLQWGDFRRA